MNPKHFKLNSMTGIICLLLLWISISMFNRHIHSYYLPEKIRSVNFIEEFEKGDCGIRIFELDENISQSIVESGLVYFDTDKTTSKKMHKPYEQWGRKWAKTPVAEEELYALDGFGCGYDSRTNNKDNNYRKIGLIESEIESNRAYYITTNNKEGAVFVVPKFALVAYVYQDR
jgi:hypothetical protein